jgi:hypothetical protein
MGKSTTVEKIMTEYNVKERRWLIVDLLQRLKGQDEYRKIHAMTNDVGTPTKIAVTGEAFVPPEMMPAALFYATHRSMTSMEPGEVNRYRVTKVTYGKPGQTNFQELGDWEVTITFDTAEGFERTDPIVPPTDDFEALKAAVEEVEAGLRETIFSNSEFKWDVSDEEADAVMTQALIVAVAMDLGMDFAEFVVNHCFFDRPDLGVGVFHIEVEKV